MPQINGPEIPSHRSPYCGRVDDHDPHPWSTPTSRGRGVTYQCPGPPEYSVLETHR